MKHFEYEQEKENVTIVWGVSAEARFVKETNGADADGRRGIQQTVIDEIEFTDWTKDGQPVKESEVPAGIRDILINSAWECDGWDSGQSQEDAEADEGDRKYHEAKEEGRI